MLPKEGGCARHAQRVLGLCRYGLCAGSDGDGGGSCTYLTDDEKAQFIDGYLSEGDFDANGSVKIFPVAKSTEVMLFNDTDWQPFAEAPVPATTTLPPWKSGRHR